MGHRVNCRGGCGTLLDPDLYPDGMCEDCEERSYNWNREPPRWRA